ncbi:hypothetical protein FA95DRAFT_1595007 [Auriscalpium vulgare]|uniref:Uncharacterized protein n=1 Tax=Auriscalpium vulgare TaxID=40419 RepID=A0ACB8RXQ3_9AGAM|nr:hypothetical protein FA95DRAFT_1595007 [Auriscalpium vulgare]
MSSSIDGLPNEVLHDVLGQLDYKGILSFQTTCRQFKTFVDSDLELQYTIKLGSLAMCEGPDARCLNVSERLQRLHAYEVAQATSTIELEELPFVPSLGDDVGDIFISVTTLVSTISEDDGLRVCIQQMPSVARGIQECHWSLWFSDLSYSVAAVDASQDLLVLMAEDAVLRLLTLSTGERHPSTVFETGMPMPWRIAADECEFVEVFGDFCAAKLHRTGSVILYTWNWKTWTGLARIPIHQLEEYNFSRLTFLNDAYIAAVADDLDAILVYGFRSEDDEECMPTKFMLPSIDPRPAATLIPCAGVSGAAHAGYFHPIPSARMLSIHISSLVRSGMSPLDSEEFLLMIPVDTLLAHLSFSCHPNTKAAEVPWSSWGPLGSRLAPVPLGINETIEVGVSAMRLVVGSDTGDHVTVAVADCCPLRVAQARSRGASVDEVVDVGDGLMKTMLPCVVKEVVMPWLARRAACKVIVCEDQLFVLKMQGGILEPSVAKAWASAI